MTKARGDKGQRRAAKGHARGRGAGARAQARHGPAVLASWEDFDATTMAEYVDAVEKEIAGQLDALEEALRGEN